MKKRLGLVLILILLASIAAISFYFTSPVDSNDNNVVQFTVNQNEGSDLVLNRLEKSNLIKSATFAKYYAKIGNNNQFKAGTFDLKRSYSLKTILQTLNDSSKATSTNVTFLEGYRVIDFAKVASEKLGIDKQSFLDACNDVAFIKSLKPNNQLLKEYNFTSKSKYFLEGLLAPDTYNVAKKTDAKGLIKILTDQANKVYLENIDLFKKSNLSVREVYTLASIIEVEAKTYDDRVLVASIFMNRIKNDISLGSDVTTYYGLQLDMGARDLTKEELAENNGYNTRSNMKGLPVGPINSPSKDAIKAALSYTKTDYLYFVSDKNGKIYPSKTYEEHNKIIDDLKAKGLWFTY